MTKQITRYRLSREEGLVTAVIALAAGDAQSKERWRRQDALSYFVSDTYQDHLAFLDLPADFLPEGFKR